MFLGGPHCRWPLYRFLVFCDHHPICLFICVSCLSFHLVFVMILVLCSWVLAHTLFYFWGVGHLIYSIKTLWTYHWDFLNSFLSNVYYYCSTLLLEFVQIILSNTSASSSDLNCHCPVCTCVTAFWRSGLQSCCSGWIVSVPCERLIFWHCSPS